jgi:hypothetical protein
MPISLRALIESLVIDCFGNRLTVQATIYSNRLVSSLSAVAINNAFASAQMQPSHNLMAIDRDLLANSRGVSMVVTQ